MFNAGKTRMIGMVKKNNDYVMPFSSDTGTLRTDEQTDGQICDINIARQYADAR